MSDMTARPPQHRKPSALSWLLESFWVVDVLVLGMLAFFVIVGGSSSTPVVIVGSVLALLYAAHAVHRHNARGAERSLEERRVRERRGF
jgi:quinol-cytochrome oxidoreductase complex cytochrome b subunit